jgi:hypothetical protein
MFGSLLLAVAPFSATAGVIFSDNFESGTVSGWTLTTDKNGHIQADSESPYAGTYALEAWFDAPSDATGAGYVRATHSFTVATAGDYTLDLWARSAPCGGCTMSYDIFVNDVQLAHTYADQFEFRTFTLSGLTAGENTLTLGMYTDGASSGHFSARFDDVSIYNDAAEAPEPGSAILLGGAALTLCVRRWRSRKPSTPTGSRT